MSGRRSMRRLLGLAGAAAFAAALAACDSKPSIELLPFPGADGSAQARLTSDRDGNPVLSWIEADGDTDVLRFARFGNGAFEPAREVVRSDRMFVNWADFPSVTPITDRLWFAHWLRLKPDSFLAYDIATEVSTDGGASWISAEQMNEDATAAEHGFVSVFEWNDQIAAFWLDGRELANWSFDEPDALLGVSLRLARYGSDGRVLAREITDALVCDCCQPDVALSGSGPIVIYRDRTEDEIRDVVVRRYVGGAWSQALGLGNEGWYLEACPVNGPVIAAAGDTVVAAWFTAAGGHSRVRFARSGDGGASFAAAIDIETRRALGQPAIVLDDDGRALVSWWRASESRAGESGGSRADGIDLMVRTVDRDGAMGEPIPVGHESIGMAADVPQMIAAGEAYLVAWTSLGGNGSVRVARLELPR